MKKEYKASEDQFKKLYPSPLQRRKDIGGAVLKTAENAVSSWVCVNQAYSTGHIRRPCFSDY